jgi:hypothetical protein
MGKDHFVPRHYLRQFSVNGHSELIAVANISPYRFVGIKGIGGQCQEQDFEEGDKALGRLLGMTENDIAPVLLRVCQNAAFTEPEAVALKWLAATLRFRTRKAARAYEVFPKRIIYEVIDDAIQTGKLPPPPEGEWKDSMVKSTGVTGFLVRNVLPCWMEMRTLATKLLYAEDGAFFVTSDNPFVMLNQFCMHAEPQRSFVGFGRSGFQALLPISPKLCLIFFDQKVYKVGPRSRQLVPVSRDDVEIINALQIQSAENSLYFHDSNFAKDVERLCDTYASLRLPVSSFLATLPGRNADEEVLHFRAPSVRLPKQWRFCRLRDNIKCDVGDRRDPAWTALIEGLVADIEKNPSSEGIFSRIQRIIADPMALRNIQVR